MTLYALPVKTVQKHKRAMHALACRRRSLSRSIWSYAADWSLENCRARVAVSRMLLRREAAGRVFADIEAFISRGRPGSEDVRLVVVDVEFAHDASLDVSDGTGLLSSSTLGGRAYARDDPKGPQPVASSSPTQALTLLFV